MISQVDQMTVPHIAYLWLETQSSQLFGTLEDAMSEKEMLVTSLLDTVHHHGMQLDTS